jgi:hypothetical protein
MERAHHVADDLGGFLVRPVGIEPQQAHAVDDAPMHRLQPVARVRQGALGDGRQGVGEIALLQRLTQVDDLLARLGRQGIRIGHGGISGFESSIDYSGTARESVETPRAVK